MKPDWRKLVIPVLFIALFMYTLSFFHTVGLISDKYNCGQLRLLAELNEADLRNDTIAFNETLRRLWLVEDQFSSEFTGVIQDNLRLNKPFFTAISVIDPLLPVPHLLEGYWNHPKPSVNYMSRETYDCMLAEISRIKNTAGGLYAGGSLYIPGRCSLPDCVSSETVYHLEKIEYHPPSNPLIYANIIFLLVEGYLFSCIILSIYGKFRNRG